MSITASQRTLIPSHVVILDANIKSLFSNWTKFSQHSHILNFCDDKHTALQSNTRFCNSCKRRIHDTNIAGIWRCDKCDFDVCALCMVREKALINIHIPLSHPHPLNRFADTLRVHDVGRFCNVCSKTINTCGIPCLYSCTADDFDMCFGCYALAAVTFRMTEHTAARQCNDAVRTNSHNTCDLLRQENNYRSQNVNITCDYCKCHPATDRKGTPIFSCVDHDTDACQVCVGKYVANGKPFPAIDSANKPTPVPVVPVPIPVTPLQPSNPVPSAPSILPVPTYPPFPYPVPTPYPPPSNHDGEIQGLQHQIADLTRQLQSERQAHDATKQELAALRRAIGSGNTNSSSNTNTYPNDIMQLREQLHQHETTIAIYEGKTSTAVNIAVERLTDEDLDNMLEKADSGKTILKNEKERRTTCTICLTNKKAILFLPCRHMCTCNPCSTSTNACPLCRQTIKERIKVYN